MNVALRRPWTIEEFLTWEERQALRYEFDGVDAHAMTGSAEAHAVIQATIFTMSEEGPREISYRAAEHFTITKRFLNDPDGMLKTVLEPDED